MQLKTVALGRDFGTTVEILSGLSPADAVVVSPSDSLEDGEQVHVAQGGGKQ